MKNNYSNYLKIDIKAIVLRVHPENPSSNQIQKIVDVLKNGGLIIYPTDSVYGLGCDINNHKAVERVAQLKNVKPEKANFSFICYDLSDASDYTKPIDSHIFKILKKNLPGPFTFILPASKKVPKLFENKKKTIGIRIPDNNIPREIVKALGNPILTTSIHDSDEIIEYTTDPELIIENYKDKVEIIINGGYGNNVATTVVDCTNNEINIIRQGLSELKD